MKRMFPSKADVKKEELEVTLIDQHGKILVSYRPENNDHQDMPPACSCCITTLRNRI